MKRIYYLSTCDTCTRILRMIDTEGVEMVNIREQNISKEDLQYMRKKTGSYEALFNKRAQKLREMTPNEKPSTDLDYKKLILKDYTFLKRPAAILDGQVIAGNDDKAVATLVRLLPKNT